MAVDWTYRVKYDLTVKWPSEYINNRVDAARFIEIFKAGLDVIESRCQAEYSDCDEDDPERLDALATLEMGRDLWKYLNPPLPEDDSDLPF